MRSSGNSQTGDCSGSRRQSRENASHEEEQQLTAGELRDLSNNPELSDSCYGFMHNMRGTIAYWQRAKLDLLVRGVGTGPADPAAAGPKFAPSIKIETHNFKKF